MASFHVPHHVRGGAQKSESAGGRPGFKSSRRRASTQRLQRLHERLDPPTDPRAFGSASCSQTPEASYVRSLLESMVEVARAFRASEQGRSEFVIRWQRPFGLSSAFAPSISSCRGGAGLSPHLLSSDDRLLWTREIDRAEPGRHDPLGHVPMRSMAVFAHRGDKHHRRAIPGRWPTLRHTSSQRSSTPGFHGREPHVGGRGRRSGGAAEETGRESGLVAISVVNETKAVVCAFPFLQFLGSTSSSFFSARLAPLCRDSVSKHSPTHGSTTKPLFDQFIASCPTTGPTSMSGYGYGPSPSPSPGSTGAEPVGPSPGTSDAGGGEGWSYHDRLIIAHGAFSCPRSLTCKSSDALTWGGRTTS